MDTKLVAKVGLNNPNNDKALLMLKSTVVTKHSRPRCLRLISLKSHPEEEFCKYKPEIRVEQTLGENRSHQSLSMLLGIRNCMVLTEYSACTISRIHLFDDKFPTVGVHNLTNALGLRLAESGFKLLIVTSLKQLSLSLYAC